MKKSVGIASFVLILASCSLFRAKIAPYPSGIVFPIEKAAEIVFQGEIIDPMLAEKGRIYIATRGGRLYGIDAAAQKILWEIKISENLQVSPRLGQEALYVIDGKNILFSVSREGKILWQKNIEGTAAGSAIENEGRVFLGTVDGRLMALDAARGETLWVFQANVALQSNIVAAANALAFGCDDGHLYLVGMNGKLIGKIDVGVPFEHNLAADGSSIYLGTGKKEIFCFDASSRKRKWKIKTGGKVLVPPTFDEKRAFFSCLNNVLYCVNKKSGTILWWDAIPGRNVNSLALVQKRVVITPRSSFLVSFETLTGEKIGGFDAGREFRSNPLWLEPFLLTSFYDASSDKGFLTFFRKKVAVTLSSTPESPQRVNTQIEITVKPVGFHLPKFEFMTARLSKLHISPYFFILLKEPDSDKTGQDKSEENSWQWFPEEVGLFALGVKVVDGKEEKEGWIPYAILKEEPEVTLAFSKKSPQPVGEEIVFKATAKGITGARYEYKLSRLYKFRFFAESYIFSYISKDVVQEKSESNTWTWKPEKAGIYAIEVTADNAEEKADAVVFFRVYTKKEVKSEAEEKKGSEGFEKRLP